MFFSFRIILRTTTKSDKQGKTRRRTLILSRPEGGVTKTGFGLDTGFIRHLQRLKFSITIYSMALSSIYNYSLQYNSISHTRQFIIRVLTYIPSNSTPHMLIKQSNLNAGEVDGICHTLNYVANILLVHTDKGKMRLCYMEYQ
jgi:hypothetical protein